MLVDLHPSSTAGYGKPQLRWRFRAPYETQEVVTNCPHCGLPNNDKVKPPNELGEGNKVIDVSINTPSGAQSFKEPMHTQGCRLCGLHPRESSYKKPLFSTVNLQGR